MKSLSQIIEERPFPDYSEWWEMGNVFMGFISKAIVSQWSEQHGQQGSLSQVQTYVAEYLLLVYNRGAHPSLVNNFQRQDFDHPIYSGEFDALSYAFYRSAFESLGAQTPNDLASLARGRRSFTKRVGKLFFKDVHDHLRLSLPADLKTTAQFARLRENIRLVGEFLQGGGYLRDGFAFSFAVHTTHRGNRMHQGAEDFIHDLQQNGVGYALYEMRYPAILPSAVYLYHTLGEAQHHSSRIIEEMFDRIGYEARETDDFDPTGFSSDSVVELWEIRPL